MDAPDLIPLWLKLAYTLATVGILAVYWVRYGPGNYLWFSDVALIITVPALWLESSLLASAMLVGVLLPEGLWNLSFFSKLLLGMRITGMTDYMFEKERPLWLRGLSLFHVPMPIVLVWMVFTLGYHPQALIWMTVIGWIVLPASYFLTRPERNVNWVRGPGGENTYQRWMPPLAYLGCLMAGFPLLLYLPTHLLLTVLFMQ